MIDRRRFVGHLAVGLLAAPLVAFPARAQRKVWRIGFIYSGSRQSALDTGRYAAFLQGLAELGYVGKTDYVLEECFTDGKTELIPGLVAELMRANVDVIVATGSQVYRPLQVATTTVPVVITITTDPIANGYAVSLARPGGNFTGLTNSGADILFKQVQLLRQAAPKMSRLGVVLNPDNLEHPRQFVRLVSFAQKTGMQVLMAELASAPDVEREFSMLAAQRVDGVMILGDNQYAPIYHSMAVESLKRRLPSISGVDEYAAGGGLMSYGFNLLDNFRRAAVFVDRILKGAKPGDLPFEQPTRFYLTLNRTTAKSLGVRIPEEMMLRADTVIP